ncbi:hypothetical protein [Photobacterium nomapromontoriensis]|uniref:hypothetical protein n=1 Tax=Photobacterium nomapromontoriensis TaxID=2910237 RepID=UPI003D138846
MNNNIFIVTSLSFLLSTTACAEDSHNTQFNTLHCLGTEPFWSIDLQENDIRLEDLNMTEQHFKLTQVIMSSNHTNKWFLTAKSKNQNDLLTISLSKTGQCSDDMSDFNYEYEIIVSTPDALVLSGCCNRIDTTEK